VHRQQAGSCNVPNAGVTGVPPRATLYLGNQAASDFLRFRSPEAVELLPSAPCSLERTVSGSARIRLAQPLRICRCRRYRRTVSSPEAPAIRLAIASKAARIFSLTISSALRRALLPPRISFINRGAITPFASAANNIKELTNRRPPNSQDERAEMVPDSSLSDSARTQSGLRPMVNYMCALD
jgi:hypothetical protein